MTSILPALYAQVEQSPDRLLYSFLDINGRPTESYSYAQFLRRTSEIAAFIQRRHALAPGDRVLLAYPPGVEMICAFFACVRLGLIPVPVYPPTGTGFRGAIAKLDFIARDCQAAAVLSTRAYQLSMHVNETRHRVTTLSLKRSAATTLPWIITTDADRGAASEVREAHSDILFLQYTSGSTSEPKGVIVTHDNILANCEAVVDHLPIGVSWLPQYHDMGLIGYYIFFALKGGTTYGFSPMDFIQRPALWLQTISTYRGTASSAPNFAYEYCLRPDKIADEHLANLDLSSLRFLMTAAEPVRADIYRKFLDRFEPLGLPRSSFFAAYGLAEFTLAVSNYGRTVQTVEQSALLQGQIVPAAPDTTGKATTTLVSCGTPLGDTEIKIVDTTDGTRDTGEAAVGEIWMRGRSKCRGYWQKPELSTAHFEARLPGDAPDAPTWLRSGDLGFLLDGELFVCGRSKDLIIVRGLNYYPQDIEVVVDADRLLRRGCTAAFAFEHNDREQLVVVAELRDPRRVPEVRELNRRLQRTLGVTATTFVFVKARTIPKTSSGKIARHLVRQRWLAGELSVLHQITVDDSPVAEPSHAAHEWLRRFGLRGDEAWTLDDAGFDSLRLVDFAQTVKARLEQTGDYDLSHAIDLRVLRKIAIAELVELLDQVAAAAPHAKLRLKRALADLGHEHRTREAELMLRDTKLRFDPTLLTQSSPRSQSHDGSILLTGGTGFFGPFLLASLLAQESCDIDVLVRATDTDPLQRIREGLQSIAADGYTCPEGWERRVRVVQGDLAVANLGLDDRTWNALADRVHTVYHNGALVNYLLDYRAMRDANVGGTNEVVRLAMSRRLKVLNLISTTFIFGWSVQDTLFETDSNEAMERLDFGYSQSKWVSEQVVRHAMQQGLPGRIFRPALLTPTVHGGGSNMDIAVRLLAFMINHGLSTSAQNQVSFSPADAAADNIVATARIPDSLGGTYHVTRDAFASLSEITAIVHRLTGRTFRELPLSDFVPEVIQRCHAGDSLFPLLEFLVRSVDNITAMEFKRYDNSRFQHFRAATAAGRPDLSLDDVVLGMLRFMRQRRLISI